MTFCSDCTVFTQVPWTEVYRFSLLLWKMFRSYLKIVKKKKKIQLLCTLIKPAARTVTHVSVPYFGLQVAVPTIIVSWFNVASP